MVYSPSAGPREVERFSPAHMLNIWSTRWPNVCNRHFKAMIGPYASEIAKHESDGLISDKRPRISLRDIIAEHVQSILKPELLAETYRERALWGRRLVPNLGTSRLPHMREFRLFKSYCVRSVSSARRHGEETLLFEGQIPSQMVSISMEQWAPDLLYM